MLACSAAAASPPPGGTRRARRVGARARPAHRVPLWRYVLDGPAATAATAPVIYALVVPFAVLDAAVSIYQAICFRAWGIAPVPRGDHFAFDRRRLPYLNALERLNCLYCSYVNGLIGYVGEIAARTEQYWCPIRHARPARGAHHRAASFAEYGDARAYRDRLPLFRAALKRYTGR
jgi:hypothetical protein